MLQKMEGCLYMGCIIRDFKQLLSSLHLHFVTSDVQTRKKR